MLNSVFLALALALAAAAHAADPCRLRPDPGPCRGAFPRYFFNTHTKSCDTFIWGGCDGVVPFQTKQDCLDAQCAVPPCRQKPVPGPCRGSFPRYFFNPDTQKCEKFIWGGCKGNVPFETLADCQRARCARRDPCREKPDVGPCDGAFPRYFYNPHKMMCERFFWGGCGGNVPFDTLEKCESTCEPHPCDQKPDRGPCKALFHKYFFNKLTGKCERFVWGGCLGNVPFDTKEECEKARCSA